MMVERGGGGGAVQPRCRRQSVVGRASLFSVVVCCCMYRGMCQECTRVLCFAFLGGGIGSVWLGGPFFFIFYFYFFCAEVVELPLLH